MLAVSQLIIKEQKEQHIFPGGAYEKFTPASKDFRIVYEGQQQPGCFGDIEKVSPLINHDGKITGMNVICKPEVTTPAK